MDAIGDLLTTGMSCLLIGERPGLMTAESLKRLSLLQAKYGENRFRSDGLSNIHRGGTPPMEAGAHIGGYA